MVNIPMNQIFTICLMFKHLQTGSGNNFNLDCNLTALQNRTHFDNIKKCQLNSFLPVSTSTSMCVKESTAAAFQHIVGYKILFQKKKTRKNFL